MLRVDLRALRVLDVFVARAGLAGGVSTTRRAWTTGSLSRSRAAIVAIDSTDARTPVRASRTSALARTIDVSMRRATTRIARVSTTVPSLMSARNTVRASLPAHSRVTAAAPSVASQNWRGAASTVVVPAGRVIRSVFDIEKFSWACRPADQAGTSADITGKALERSH
jgi:hypothetical protein